MNQPAAHLASVDQLSLTPELRRRYEDILARATRYAERIVPEAQAFEVAHDVAIELLRDPNTRVSGALILMRVGSRLLNARLAADRRARNDRAYVDMHASVMSQLARPDSELEARELSERIQETLAAMPARMRAVFLLVREEEMSYKEAAARLGISRGTVHTQLSRANALLRECVSKYYDGVPRSTKGQQP